MTTPSSPVDSIAKAMRDHIKVDATGLNPAIATAFVFGFDEAAKAVVELVARQEKAMKQRAEDAEALAERLKLEAQAHAMEARTANSTINEIYQVVSGGNGEPGNWHGAAPVREKFEAMKREMADIRKSVRNAIGAIESNQVVDKDVHGTLTRVLARLDALIGGGNAED